LLAGLQRTYGPEGLRVLGVSRDAEPEKLEALTTLAKALGVELPASVELEITDTIDQPKSATATNQLKEATVETGARVRVPPFIEIGQVVKINTETGEYLGKA